MFGYIRAYKPEMTFSQYDIYKGIYCSLCKAIGKNYGLLARMTLSYDFAFFALMRMSVSDTCSGFKKSRCSFNFTKKCLECSLSDEDLVFSCDVSMLMVYFKYLDNIQDSRGVKRAFLRLFSSYFKRIGSKGKKRSPEAYEILEKMHFDQIEAENNESVIFDQACHPSADALGKLLSCGKNDQKNNLYKFGYMIGRWVYIIDALDDYQKDKTENNFNPFLFVENFNVDYAVSSLNLTVSEAISALEKMKIIKYKKIIENIVYDGLRSSLKVVTERIKNEKSV